MKCEGCPLNTSTERDGIYCLPVDILAEPGLHEICELTEAHQRIIDAMIAGEWRCDTCVRYRTESSCGWASKCACEIWQPKEGGE